MFALDYSPLGDHEMKYLRQSCSLIVPSIDYFFEPNVLRVKVVVL
jgi:hypothetical protein